MTAPSEADALLAQLGRWTPAGQEQALDLLERTRAADWRPWWCGDRTCDGRAHGNWEWGHARGDQTPPRGGWDTWIELSGRGAGKTRSGSEWTHRMTTRTRYLALVAPTGADARDTMVEGESGLLATMDPRNPCLYEPSKRRVTWRNGARGTLFSAEEPDRLRGPQHGAAWMDEACFYGNVQAVWDNLQFGLRLGRHPRCHITTTPKPRPWLLERLNEPQTIVTKATTYANLANLAPTFQRAVLGKYEGTRLGRQEIDAEVLEDIEGALWSYAMIDADRVPAIGATSLDRIIVSVDPPGSSTGPGAEAGIIVLGRAGSECYVLSDLSDRMTPAEWGKAAVDAFHRWQADAIVAETNYGGEMVVGTLRTVPGSGTIPIRTVTARRGKALRAEPVVALYEQHHVHHIGVLAGLETQLTSWVPGETPESPDRLDALVHGVTDLMIKSGTSLVSSPAAMGRRVAGSYMGAR